MFGLWASACEQLCKRDGIHFLDKFCFNLLWWVFLLTAILTVCHNLHWSALKWLNDMRNAYEVDHGTLFLRDCVLVCWSRLIQTDVLLRGYLNKCSIHCFVIKWHPVKSTYYRICGKKYLRWQLLLADYELKYATAQRLKGQLALESLGAIINYASTMMVAMLKSKCGVIYLFLYIHCEQISLEMFW